MSLSALKLLIMYYDMSQLSAITNSIDKRKEMESDNYESHYFSCTTYEISEIIIHKNSIGIWNICLFSGLRLGNNISLVKILVTTCVVRLWRECLGSGEACCCSE